MPRRNGTGPGGMGPMTGRAAGYCAGFETPGFVNPIAGRGLQRGGGHGGRGRRNMFYVTGLPGWMRGGNAVAPVQCALPETEKQALQQQTAVLQQQLDAITKHLSEIETDMR